MSIMDIFKGFSGAQQNQGQQAPVNADQNPAVPNSNTIQNMDGSGPAAIPKAAEGEQSPLENYKDLWQKSDNSPAEVSLVPSLVADPNKLMEAAGRIDFTKALNPELLSKAATGDASALAAVVNQAAQAGFAQSAAATTKIVEAALAQQEKAFHEKVMPDILRKHTINTTLGAENPLFENPAVKPMLDMAIQQFTVKYPTAAPAEIKRMAGEYLKGFAEEMAKASGKSLVDISSQETKNTARQDTDWEKFFAG